jgi:hypothetical protein
MPSHTIIPEPLAAPEKVVGDDQFVMPTTAVNGPVSVAK